MSGFDRNFYLAMNPDVAEAGMDPEVHYLRYGQFEGRKCCPISGTLDPTPIGELFAGVCVEIHPDDEMFKVVQQNSHIRHPEALYMSTGQWIHEDTTKVLQSVNVDLDSANSLLDFASGYGRVTRFWLEQFKETDIWVADVQHAAVDFLSATLGVHGLYPLYEPSHSLFPRKFDLITVISLFSHLPQIRTKQWLTNLADALEPGGAIVLSFHGVDLLEPALRVCEKSGILFEPVSESTVLPVSEYGTTYLTHDYLAQLVDGIEGISLVGIYQRGLCGFQDLAVIIRSK